ncbi:MAG: ABC transporter permease, partial [Clostridia bacterium]|nr:ABC transporter permease [Clostridia bacterium]
MKTYSGSALGWAWAVIRPVVTILIYWFAMSVGFKKNGLVYGHPYFLWLITGLVPWFYMSDMLTQGTDCMRKYRYLITKMRYPVSTIPTFVSISKMMVSMVLLFVVAVIYWIMGFAPTIYYLQIFIYILFSFMFFTSWALFAGPISAISQDFSNLIRSFVFAVLWCSGIFWDATEVGGTLGLILKA